MEKFDESMIGRKVVFTNYEAHENEPNFYPPVGTIGTIVSTKGTGFDDVPFAVQWEKGTTSDDDLWVVSEKSIELLNEENTGCNSIGFFLQKLVGQLWGKSTTDWVVTNLGSVYYKNDWYWSITIKNIKSGEEKIIKIPCYKG